MKILLTEIEIVFENSEIVTVPANFVEDIRIVDIKGSLFGSGEDILRMNYADKIFLKLDSRAAAQIARIQRYDDITGLKLKFSDGTSENIYARWEGSDERNSLQRSYFDAAGDFVVKIVNG